MHRSLVHRTVFELFGLHDCKRVKVELARERDTRFNSPIVVVLLEELVMEYEPRFVPKKKALIMANGQK